MTDQMPKHSPAPRPSPDALALEFKRGYLLACTNLQNLHDEPTMAAETLAQVDITARDVVAMDLSEYDARALREIRKICRYDPILEGPGQ